MFYFSNYEHFRRRRWGWGGGGTKTDVDILEYFVLVLRVNYALVSGVGEQESELNCNVAV